MKLIDADKLRAELERRITDNTFGAKLELIDILAWLDTLESERPEPYNPVYDEAYLNEKIAKASKTWKGVDVDKYMDEVRGRGPDKSLEEAADKHIRKVVDAAGHPGWDWTTQDITEAFIAGAKWQKQQMLKDAVEGEIVQDMKGLFHAKSTTFVSDHLYNFGEKVRLIIVKEGEK